MTTIVYALLIVLTVALTAMSDHAISGTWPFLLGVALVLAIPWYFGTRDRSKPASTPERVLARSWVWFRRIVCFGIASFCFTVAYWIVAYSSEGALSLQSVVAALGFAIAGVMIVLLGLFGYATYSYGDNAGAWRAYLANKARYGRRKDGI